MKYLLQSRNKLGHIISLGTFERLITPEEALQQFGPNDYTLKSVSPRFKVQWKHKQERTATAPENSEGHLQAELGSIGRKTKLHTYAIIGLGAVTAVGFGLSHLRFSDSEARLTRLEAVAGTLSAGGLRCPNCSASLNQMLQKYCSNCGTRLAWPKTLPPPPPETQVEACQKCGSIMRSSDNFCLECGTPRQPTVRFIQASPWRLP